MFGKKIILNCRALRQYLKGWDILKVDFQKEEVKRYVFGFKFQLYNFFVFQCFNVKGDLIDLVSYGS